MVILGRILGSSGILILIAAAGIWFFWEQLPIRLVWPYVAPSEIPINGEVQKVIFTGSEAGEQTFFIYLPTGYESGDEQYRVLYHLHGAYAREPWVGKDCNKIGAGVEKAVEASIIEPMIVACPVDPEGDGMWSDSFDGQYLASTAMIKDLIPYVDANYRTIAERNGRALQGFSMGGFGAALNGFRTPELFKAIIIWDGALHDWNTLSTTRESIATEMFATEDYFNQWSPFEWATKSADVEMDLFMVVGTMEATRDFASRYRPHLENTEREFTYHDSACPHSIFCMIDEFGDQGFAFLAASFNGK